MCQGKVCHRPLVRPPQTTRIVSGEPAWEGWSVNGNRCKAPGVDIMEHRRQQLSLCASTQGNRGAALLLYMCFDAGACCVFKHCRAVKSFTNELCLSL